MMVLARRNVYGSHSKSPADDIRTAAEVAHYQSDAWLLPECSSILSVSTHKPTNILNTVRTVDTG